MCSCCVIVVLFRLGYDGFIFVILSSLSLLCIGVVVSCVGCCYCVYILLSCCFVSCSVALYFSLWRVACCLVVMFRLFV